jgi:CheY-like chemotaxis protein
MDSLLLVEDTAVLAEQIADLLMMEGYEVVIAGNGVEALDRLSSFTPGLVITDLQMPEMDGFELIRRMKDDERLNDIPIIVLTAKSVEETDQALSDLGITCLLRKPCPADDLVEKVNAMVNTGGIVQDTSHSISA